MKTIIDIDSWERKENYSFFKDFLNPFYSVTCRVNGGQAKAIASQRKESFFIHYLYAIVHAINQIEEMRYRIDTNGEVVLYDKIDILAPIKLKHMTRFSTIRIPYSPDRSLFYREASELISKADTYSAYSVENDCKEFDLALISAVPELPFTSITSTQRHRNGSDYPLINVGQMDKDHSLPVAISVHHGFVDGEHLSIFFRKVQENLDQI